MIHDLNGTIERERAEIGLSYTIERTSSWLSGGPKPSHLARA